MIYIANHSDLNAYQLAQQKQLIAEEFGHIPIVAQTKWATPKIAVMKYQKDEIFSFYNIIEREITIDGSNVKAIGINNVITSPAYRGNNYAFNLLKETQQEILDKLKAEVGLLLCAEHMLPYYSRLNWCSVDCPVYFEKDGRSTQWMAYTMLLDNSGKFLSPNHIDINGLPW